jgi:hypothetical protein
MLSAKRGARGQEPRGLELATTSVVVLSDPLFAGAGLQGAIRPGGRGRIALGVFPGMLDERFALRGELVAHFLLSPGGRRGVGFYGLGGVAGLTGPRDRAYLMLGVGVEANPGGRSGWMLEAGVGGGARIAAGWRWRRLERLVGAPP